MRPIRLEIAGLQSFSNKQIIDFETLGSEGIFGIFGETGSGKSTILDAMILALFDEIPRLKGQTKSIASCLNHECNQIEIKFKFALDKKIFEIYRGYRRRVNKKGEEKFEQINPILKMDGVIIADTVRNFALKIDEYLGVTASDFTKTVILPQGKFSEFLKLKSAEKMEMLEKIFDLEIYGSKMSEKLKLKNTKVKDEVMALENQLKGVGEFSLELMEELKNSLLKNEEKLKNITLDKYRQEKLYDEMKELKRNFELHCEYEEKIKNLDNQSLKIATMRDALKKDEIAKELKSIHDEIKNLKSVIDKNTTQTMIFQEEVEKLEKDEREIDESFKLHEKKLSEVENNIKKVDFDYNELDKLRNLEKILIEIESKTELFKGYKEREEELKKEVTELKNKISKNNYDISVFEKNIEESQFYDDPILLNLKEKKEALSNIILISKKERARFEELSEDIKNLVDKIEKLNFEKKEIEKEIQKIEKKRHNNFAYELSKQLINGMPCPVCGSRKHIELAHDICELNETEYRVICNKAKEREFEIVKSENELFLKKQELEQYENRKNIEELECEIRDIETQIKILEKIKKDIENEKTKNTIKAKEFFKQNLILNDEILKKEDRVKNIIIDSKRVEEEILTLKEKVGEVNKQQVLMEKVTLEKREKEKRELLNIKSNLEKKILECKEKTSSLMLMKQKIELNITRISGENKQLHLLYMMKDNLLNEKKKLLNLSSDTDITSWLLNDDEQENFTNSIENYERELQKYNNLIDEIKIKIGTREFSYENWEEIKKSLSEVLEREKFYIGEIEKQKSELNRYTELEKKNNIILEKLKKVKEEEDNIQILAKRFEGRKFVKFLVRKKLEYISFEASKRLQKITRGRYQLTVNKNCDFNIIDNFNNCELRDCATLSGGETFIVSLVLALALSTQLQLKGNIQLEFFFLDEGFGTLDESLLDRVIESLEEIRWNEKVKIGIISHVNDLKIRIPRRIEVFPPIQGEFGSRIKMF